MNAHNFHAIRRRIADAYERAKKEGSDMAEICESLMKMEVELCRIEIDRCRATCDLIRCVGTTAYAERRGVHRVTARRRQLRALNKMMHKTRV